MACPEENLATVHLVGQRFEAVYLLHICFPSRFNSFHPETHKPMHRECGFIRLKPDTNKVAFVSAQNTGMAPLTQGLLVGVTEIILVTFKCMSPHGVYCRNTEDIVLHRHGPSS